MYNIILLSMYMLFYTLVSHLLKNKVNTLLFAVPLFSKNKTNFLTCKNIYTYLKSRSAKMVPYYSSLTFGL